MIDYDEFSRNVHVNAKVEHYRAPTDDSIRLYEEIREKALKSIVDSVKIGNNTLEARVFMRQNAHDWRTLFIVIFKLNGKQYQVETSIEDLPKKYSNMKEAAIAAIQEALVKKLAMIITAEIYPELRKQYGAI